MRLGLCLCLVYDGPYASGINREARRFGAYLFRLAHAKGLGPHTPLGVSSRRPAEEDLGWLKMFQLPKVPGPQMPIGVCMRS